jgi:polyribonucleotide nucleotidyltransferase
MSHKKYYSQVFNIAGKEIEVSTGKIAIQSHGAIMLKMGGTVLLATASVDNKDTDLDYFPLSVEYIEKMYARGAMSGSKFKKREGLPSDEAVIKAREVDHSIRSLFPKSFKKPVSVVLTVLAYDGENDPQCLTVLGTSLALMQSGVPFWGPCASVVIGIDKDKNIVINPVANERESFEGEFIISAGDEKILSLEGWGKEVPEDLMGQVLDKAVETIKQINSLQNDFVSNIDKALDFNLAEFDNKPVNAELLDKVMGSSYEEIKHALFDTNNKLERKEEGGLNKVKAKLIAESKESESPISEHDVNMAVEYIARKALRQAVMEENKRVSGRALDEIRPLNGEIDVLPTVHGSAIFNRGFTQSLSIVTLASLGNGLMIDDMEGETSKTFMHHYNMPGYANGEAGRYNYHPGRREIGHGNIGEHALKHMIPSAEEFPYTVRVVSEIMSSNGSTSMAATCASSLALMAAGVPMKEQVAGIGVGLITEDDNEDNYKLLLDIEGIEDFYGDMDFKVCGTKNGVTAIQYENKLQGVRVSIIKEAFVMAKNARMKVLETMNSIIAQPRGQVAKTAPKVESIRIDQSKIGELIGPGGKNIKGLIEASKQFAPQAADVNIDDTGKVNITAVSEEQMNYLKTTIANMFEEAVVGKVYDGIVSKVMNFGAFVDVSQQISGLCHVSEISDKFVKDANEIIKVGEKVKVKVKGIDGQGRISFTMKGI